MKNLLTLAVIVLVGTNLHSQTKNTDSLLHQLGIAKEDSNKVNLLFTLADQYENSELEKAKTLVLQAGELSRKINYEPGILKMYRHLSYLAAYQSNFDSIIYYNNIVLDIAKKKKDSYNIGISLFNIGEAYKFMSDYEKSLHFTMEGLKLLEGKGYTQIESSLYGGLQGTYLLLKQYDKAAQYGLKSVELGRKPEDKTPLISALVNLANGYVEQEKIEEAKKIYNEAIALCKKFNNKSLEAMSYEGQSDIALKEGNYERLQEYASRALSLHTETGNSFGIAASKQALAFYSLTKKDFSTANQYAKEALTIADKENFTEAKAEILNTLSAIAFANTDFLNAIKYENESKKITESIFTESLAKKDAQMRVLYETDKKDAQIKLQQSSIKQKSILNYLLIGGAAALLFISLLYWKNFRNKQKLQQQRIAELETEKRLAATEAVLKGEEQERTRLAKDLHDGLGGMLSGIKFSLNSMKGNLVMTPDNAQAFERSMDMLDSSIKEMRRVAHNMMPEALVKFGLDTALKDFCNDINQSGAIQVNYQPIGMQQAQIDSVTVITIYRIVQELLNNTIKHAAANNAIVQVSKTEGILSVTVEDDGKGFDIAILKQSGGIGWDNIQNRVEFLKAKMDIDSAPGKGTSVHIEIGI